MQEANLTISNLAKAAGVGVETVRYYERRKLIQQPRHRVGAYRRYGLSHIERIRFIRRAQDLGFSLEEIATLLELEDGTDRKRIRHIASQRLAETRLRIERLQRIEGMLAHLLHDCEAHGKSLSCPIIAAMTDRGT